MRRTVLIGTVMLLVPATAAVVGTNGSGGDMRITGSGSSASATAGTGPNGTMYRATVTPRNASCATGNATDAVADTAFFTRNASTTAHGVSFTGTVRAADPCHALGHSVERVNESAYVLHVTTRPGDGVCAQCVGALTYDATFSARHPFRLTVRHDGRTVETLTVPGHRPQEETQGDGFIAALLAWIGGLL